MKNYAKTAKKIRRQVLDMVYKAQSSHIGSNFSCVDILTVLYENKKKEDEIIISKGWVAATVYALLAHKKIIPETDIATYCQDNSKYIGLLEPTVTGVKCAGGSMGYGLPFSVGFALARKIKGERGKVYCLLSDGELAIGTTWESLLIARQHKLDNLVVIVDDNGLQAMGSTEKILNTHIPFKHETVDGHDFNELEKVLSTDWFRGSDVPHIVNAITVKGKGVSFMENNNLYHYKMLTKEEYEQAKKEL